MSEQLQSLSVELLARTLVIRKAEENEVKLFFLFGSIVLVILELLCSPSSFLRGVTEREQAAFSVLKPLTCSCVLSDL